VSPGRRIRALVVDDSAFARKVLREVLGASGDVELVGFARDGIDALEKIAELAPDVVTLDLVMPELDGVGVLEALRAQGSKARVIVVSTLERDSKLAVAALQAGAFDVVHKPTAVASDRLHELAGELLEKVRAAGAPRPAATSAATPFAGSAVAPGSTRLVVVGASTGGPHAITRLFRELDASFPVPIAVVLHMPPGFTDLLAKRLDHECALEVIEARDGLPLVPGRVVIAQAGIHMTVARTDQGLAARLELAPYESLHRPSVDALFTGASKLGAGVLGIVLTGMGNDGLAGSRAIHAAGGRIITESESSCVVYGMPRCVREAGLSHEEATIADMSAALIRNL
jgi:two-component system chemotaxis response regulator CheB